MNAQTLDSRSTVERASQQQCKQDGVSSKSECARKQWRLTIYDFMRQVPLTCGPMETGQQSFSTAE